MRVWRIHDHRAAHALQPDFDPLDGRGSSLYPGRWNRQGTPLLYTSQSPELAMLELLARLAPAAFGVRQALEIEVPAYARIEDATPVILEHLLHGRDHDTQAFGTLWAAEERSLVLRVPSAVLPISSNYLINPLHAQAAELRVLRQVEVSMDPRPIRNQAG